MANNDELNLGKGKKTQGAGNKEKGGMKKIVIIGLVVLLLAGGGLGAFLFMGNKDADPAVATGGETVEAKAAPVEEEREAIYLALDPAFVVNFEHEGKIRYLQLSMQIMSYDQQVIDKVEHNMPAVRNSLIMLFSGQDFDQLNTVDGKEKLRMDALAAIHQVLRLKGDMKIDDAFFTGFVMQ